LSAGICLLVSFLNHPIPGVFAPFFVLSVVFASEKLYLPAMRDIKSVVAKTFYFSIPLFPVFLIFTTPSPHVISLVEQWLKYVRGTYSQMPILGELTDTLPGVYWGIARFPMFLLKQFGVFFIFIVAFSRLHFVSRQAIRWFIAAIFFSAVVWFGSVLPRVGIALYPDRGAPLVACLFASALLSVVQEQIRGSKNQKIPQTIKSIVTIAIVCLSITRYAWNYLIQPVPLALVTNSDLAVINQIQNLIPNPDKVR
jgi:hypothetical protein